MAQMPCVYDDFYLQVQPHLDRRRKEMLRRLLTFRFHRHSRYNLPQERLALVEQEVQRRALVLLNL